MFLCFPKSTTFVSVSNVSQLGTRTSFLCFHWIVAIFFRFHCCFFDPLASCPILCVVRRLCPVLGFRFCLLPGSAHEKTGLWPFSGMNNLCPMNGLLALSPKGTTEQSFIACCYFIASCRKVYSGRQTKFTSPTTLTMQVFFLVFFVSQPSLSTSPQMTTKSTNPEVVFKWRSLYW